MNIDDMSQSLKAALYDRVSSPLTGSLILSFFIVNYRLFYVLFTGKDYKTVFYFIDDVLYPTLTSVILNMFVFPMLSAIAFIFFYTHISYFVYQYSLKRRKEFLDIKQKIEGQKLLTEEQTQKIYSQIADERIEKRRLIEERDFEIETLKKLNIELERKANNIKDTPQATKQTDSEPLPEPSPEPLLDEKNNTEKNTGNDEKDNYIMNLLPPEIQEGIGPEDLLLVSETLIPKIVRSPTALQAHIRLYIEEHFPNKVLVRFLLNPVTFGLLEDVGIESAGVNDVINSYFESYETSTNLDLEEYLKKYLGFGVELFGYFIEMYMCSESLRLGLDEIKIIEDLNIESKLQFRNRFKQFYGISSTQYKYTNGYNEGEIIKIIDYYKQEFIKIAFREEHPKYFELEKMLTSMRNSKSSETRKEESKLPESREEESKLPESKEEESKLPESKEEESKLPESKEEESKLPESREEESKLPELTSNEFDIPTALALGEKRDKSVKTLDGIIEALTKRLKVIAANPEYRQQVTYSCRSELVSDSVLNEVKQIFLDKGYEVKIKHDEKMGTVFITLNW